MMGDMLVDVVSLVALSLTLFLRTIRSLVMTISVDGHSGKHSAGY